MPRERRVAARAGCASRPVAVLGRVARAPGSHGGFATACGRASARPRRGHIMTGPIRDEDAAGVTPASGESDLSLGMDNVSPAVLIDLLRRYQTKGGCKRFRRHERHRCQIPAQIELPALVTGPARARTLEVLTEDVSASGSRAVRPAGERCHARGDGEALRAVRREPVSNRGGVCGAARALSMRLSVQATDCPRPAVCRAARIPQRTAPPPRPSLPFQRSRAGRC